MARILPRQSNPIGYDLASEAGRIAYPDVVIGERRLNRGTAQVAVRGDVETPETAQVRAAWNAHLFPTTLASDAPVLDLGFPVHGPFVDSPHGVYFDSYLAVAQKILDERHPRFLRMLDDLGEAGVLLRREIATDDFLAPDPERRVKTPADLARLWADAASARWPIPGGYRVFFSSSGAESVEAAIKISTQAAYKRFLGRHGAETFAKVQSELGNARVPYFDRDPGLRDHPVYEDYPFALVACEGAFHGRTMGALSLTWSKRAHRLSYPKPKTVFHVPYNAAGDPLRDLVDFRGIEEVLATPGELRRLLLEKGRIPKDLFAGFVAEPFQGEGGYVPGEPEFFRKARAACDETGALLVLDEVQSVARTGRLFMGEHLGVRPDVLCVAKSMVIGTTIARADLAAAMHGGWHSNTWGAGRVLDTNFAHATLDAFLHHRDPVFDGLSYAENVEVKGRQLSEGLDRLAGRHPKILAGHRGRGLMRAILVRRRSDVVRAGWKNGLKLLGCGWDAEVAPIRILFLADTLGREIDEFLGVLDRTLSSLR
jgi:4-aminobutyrate aminotransferase-like enzyme